MNLFRETRYPDAAPVEYKGVKLFDVERSCIDIDCPRFFYKDKINLIKKVWAPSVRVESRLQTRTAQEALDKEWLLIDKAEQGEPIAVSLVQERYSGMFARQKPTSRVVEPVKVGLSNPFKYITTCNHCGSDMVVSNTKSKYCTVVCTKAAHRRAVSKINAKRPRVQQSLKCCRYCNETFMPKRADTKFCSGRCRVANMRAMNHA